MQLSTRGRYAVTAMVDLATRQTLGCECGPICLAEIAARQRLSKAYLEQLFGKLRRAGLVGSARGPGGGYRLARSSAAIAIADIVAAVDEPIHAIRCEDGGAGCVEGVGDTGPMGCPTHDLWDELGRQIQLFLEGVTLADVVAGRVLGRAVPLDAGPEAGSRVAMVYLDANATEPLRPEARAATLAALEVTGNPSSVHTAGRAARRILEDAREMLAARFGTPAQNIVFTSGGTEADALAIHALGRGRRLIIGATEHDAVRSAAPGAMLLPVDRDGVADLDTLAAWLADGPACPGLSDAGEQRDGHDPAGRRGCRTYVVVIADYCTSMPSRPPGGSTSRCRHSAPTASPSPRTSWAARRALAPCCWPPRSRPSPR